MDGSLQRKKPKDILLIDGKCLLCNGITRFVAKRDKAKAFHFASLQSRAGQQLLIEGHLPIDDLNTFVMLQDGQYFTKSEAALRMFRKLNGFWPILYMFIIVPLAWRNAIYDRIARNRFEWFGKADACLLPAAEVRERFLVNGIESAESGGIGNEK
jgi:predicted DCC family thiol-disulfide oxidoreductase YuxK